MVLVFMAIRVAFTRVKVEVPAAAPLAIATAVAELASAAGAAWTELPEIVPAMIAVVKTTPRFAKNVRSFSNARLTRLRAVTSFSFNAAADFLRRSVFKEAQHDGVAVFFTKTAHGIIQQWRYLFP